MAREIDLLTEIRDLLLVIAEPALAKRDQKLRDALRSIAGRGKKTRAAVMLMDGSRSQASIVKEAGIDPGQLSKLVKSLTAESLIAADEKQARLLVAIPKNFFAAEGFSDE